MWLAAAVGWSGAPTRRWEGVTQLSVGWSGAPTTRWEGVTSCLVGVGTPTYVRWIPFGGILDCLLFRGFHKGGRLISLGDSGLALIVKYGTGAVDAIPAE